MSRSLCRAFNTALIFCLFVRVRCNQQLFLQKFKFKGTACDSATIYDFGTTTTAVECGLNCGQKENCYSFFYNNISNACKGLRTIQTDICGEVDEGNKYFVKGNVVE